MNLASILNPTATQPAGSQSPQAVSGGEAPVGAEFAALLGMAGIPGDAALPAVETGKAAMAGGKILPDAATGLPDNLPDLPDLPVAEGLPPSVDLPAMLLAVPITMATQADKAPVAAAADAARAAAPALPTLPHPAQTLAAPSPSADPSPAGQSASSGAASAPAPVAPPALNVQLEVRPALPAAQLPATPQLPPDASATRAAEAVPPTAPQALVQPLLQGTEARRTDPARIAILAPSVQPDSEAAPAPSPVALAPVAAAPAPVPLLGDAPRLAVDPQALQPSAAAAPADRHDFSAIVDRLAEARELARPGRASMQLAHREFGPVSIQFDMAGSSLKVALASADAAFAPAVQAALAERPILAPGEGQAVRSDVRQDQQAAPVAGQGGIAAQADGQRQDQHSRGTNARSTPEQVQRQPQDADRDDTRAGGRSRDGSLFA